MPNIVTYEFFTGKFLLPNSAPTLPEGVELQAFIETYEANYLGEVLGYELAKLVVAAITPPLATSGVIYDLINGKEFTDRYGRANKWPGLADRQLSPIAAFVYCQMLENRRTQTTGVGEKQATAENMATAFDTQKFVTAWNGMVDMNLVLDDFLTQNATDYPTYIGIYGSVSYGNRKFFTKTNLLGI